MPNIYGVYDDEELLFTGTATDIANELGYCDTMSIYHCSRTGKLLQKKYGIKFIGFQSKRDMRMKEPEKTEYDKHLEYLHNHLMVYGNVFSNDDGSDYMDDLNELGIEFIAKPCTTTKGYILWRCQ